MIFQDEILILIFAVGGVSLKIADFYGEVENSTGSYISAAISALALGLLISHSPVSSSIIFGIIIGVALAWKVDRLNLIFGLAMTLLTALIVGFKTPIPWLILTVTIFSLIDEISHERFSSKKFLSINFFLIRPFLKLIILFITILRLISIVYAVGFFCFDLSYELTSWLLNRSLAKCENHLIQRAS